MAVIYDEQDPSATLTYEESILLKRANAEQQRLTTLQRARQDVRLAERALEAAQARLADLEG